jgi:copper chaperone CopZ
MCTACACGTGDSQAPGTAETNTKAYQVGGMTCDHCVASVSGEIGAINGVTAVTVDLPTGTVTVDGTGFSDEDVHKAVAQAGYALLNQS